MEQLRAAKGSVRSDTSHATEDQQDSTTHQAAPDDLPPSRQPCQDAGEPGIVSWTPSILGAAGLVGIYLYLRAARQQQLPLPTSGIRPPNGQKTEPGAMPPTPKPRELKLTDHFHME